jgi:hypothetical protein
MPPDEEKALVPTKDAQMPGMTVLERVQEALKLHYSPPSSVSDPQKRGMLIATSYLGRVSQACHYAGITRRQHNRWLEEDEAYSEAYSEAYAHYIDKLEAEADRRVFSGASDVVLITRLNAEMPDKYVRPSRVDMRLQVTQADPDPAAVESAWQTALARLGPDRLRQLADTLERGGRASAAEAETNDSPPQKFL